MPFSITTRSVSSSKTVKTNSKPWNSSKPSTTSTELKMPMSTTRKTEEKNKWRMGIKWGTMTENMAKGTLGSMGRMGR
jgi:hypothetical protein